MEITTTTKEKRYNVSDYLKLGEGDPHQLINGKLIALGEPSPTYGHQDVLGYIFNQIWNSLKEKPAGKVICAPLDVYFDENTVLQPDIIYISNENSHIIKENGIHGAPDLIIELLSPSTAYYDTKDKKKVYERSGVKEYWIIDPVDEEVTGYENSNGKFTVLYHGYNSFKSNILDIEILIKTRNK